MRIPPQVEWCEAVLIDGGVINALCYVMELEALCIGLASGEILMLHCGDVGGSRRMEEVGSLDGGVISLEWSPDGEVFAAISGAGRLLIMNLVSLLEPSHACVRVYMYTRGGSTGILWVTKQQSLCGVVT
jgi:hypothetical protein